MSQEYPSVLHANACGRDWAMHRPANLDTLWENMAANAAACKAFANDERIPYWTEIWPAALGLAQWLEARRTQLAGARCLDIGCGLGFTALCGAALNARVLGMDYDPEALRYARKNADVNLEGMPEYARPDWALIDWRQPALRPHSIQYAWGADIMYERRFAEPLPRFLHHLLTPNGIAWIADPGRNTWEYFCTALTSLCMTTRCVHEQEVLPLHRNPVPVRVRIWEVRRMV